LLGELLDDGTFLLTVVFFCRFEAYDEPWKESFDTDTQKWESKRGLMDENRELKDGLVIPDCDGLTVDKAY
jgi:hypothetical protein